jgi:hypothetical protein
MALCRPGATSGLGPQTSPKHTLVSRGVTRQNRHALRHLSFVGLAPDTDTIKAVLSLCRLMGMKMDRAYDQAAIYTVTKGRATPRLSDGSLVAGRLVVCCGPMGVTLAPF